MKRTFVLAFAALLSACATAPTDISFAGEDMFAAPADLDGSGTEEGKDAVLILSVGPIGTGGYYLLQQLNEIRTDFSGEEVLLGFGGWGVGDKMKRPENEKSNIWVLSDEVNFLIKKAASGTYAATHVSWNTYNGYASGTAWFCQEDGAPTFEIQPGKINLLSSRDAFPPGTVTRISDKFSEADVLEQFERTRKNYPDLTGDPVVVYPTLETRWTESSAGWLRVCGAAKEGTLSVNRIRLAGEPGERDASDEAAIKAALENAAKAAAQPPEEGVTQ